MTNEDMHKQYNEMKVNKPVMPQPGDSICAKGLTFKIGRFLSSPPECYLEWNEQADEYQWIWYVAFLDVNNNYHNWKSYYDGGEIIYAAEERRRRDAANEKINTVATLICEALGPLDVQLVLEVIDDTPSGLLDELQKRLIILEKETSAPRRSYPCDGEGDQCPYANEMNSSGFFCRDKCGLGVAEESPYVKHFADCYEHCGGEDCACCEIYQSHQYEVNHPEMEVEDDSWDRYDRYDPEDEDCD